MNALLVKIRNCTHCADHLPHGVRPVIAASANAKVLIIGQAPGRKVHETGIPWNDPSGNNLRDWLGVDSRTFYNTDHFALMPMGFCYPGKGKSGDLPPRPECAPLWHDGVLRQMKSVRITLLIGQYAQDHYLGDRAENTLTATVRRFSDFLPQFLPLPHPSPRNRLWMKRNVWFEADLLPELRKLVRESLSPQ